MTSDHIGKNNDNPDRGLDNDIVICVSEDAVRIQKELEGFRQDGWIDRRDDLFGGCCRVVNDCG